MCVGQDDSADMIKLNLGCGSAPEEGYINCDLYPSGTLVTGATEPNAGIDLILDLVDGLPFPNDSIDEIMAIQVLEHLDDPIALLKEAYRVLKPNGIIDVGVPDLTVIATEWLKATNEQRWIAIDKWPPLRAWIYGRGEGANRHLFGFDRWRLETILTEVGFRDLEVVEPFQYLSVRLRGRK